MFRTKKRIALIALVIIAIVFVSVVEFYLPRLFIIPHRSQTTSTPAAFTPFEVSTKDKLTLKCWFVSAKAPKGTVLILHAWGASKNDCVQLINPVVEHGFNVISFDNRAHGHSEGDCCTYGFKEKEDVASIITESQKRFPNLGPIGIVGVSYGAAITTQALAVDSRIKCGVIISSFCRLEDVARAQFKVFTGLENEWLFQHVAARGARMAGFRLQDVQPTESARAIRQPVLVIHGEVDELVPVSDAKTLFDHIPTPNKEWYEAKSTNHGGILNHEPLMDHVVEFLERWMH